MNVIKFLEEHGVEKLKSEKAIKVREYPEYNAMVLNYDMIESTKTDPIVMECRALILSMDSPYRVISRSFTRFFNYTECPRTTEFDFNKAVFWEKMDGSIINVFWLNGEWTASTRSMIGDAQTQMGEKFTDIFKSVFDFTKIPLRYIGNTFIFELVSPKTRVVKPYKIDDVYLLAVRYTNDEIEYAPSQLKLVADEFGVKLPARFEINEYADIERQIDTLEAFDEGFVGAIYGDNGIVHRIKFKSKSYLAIAHLRDNGAISLKKVVTLVFAQDYAEYLGYFPEDTHIFEPYIKAYEKMFIDVNETYAKFSHIESQKEFALNVKDLPIGNIMFQMRKGNVFSDIAAKLSEDSKVNLLQSYII
jgi:hypothetical protein